MIKNLAMLQLYARKIHRLCVLIITILGLLMMATGIILKYPVLMIQLFPFIDLRLATQIHGNIAPYFVIVLAVMMITGGYMYLYPTLLGFVRKPTNTKVN